VTDHILHSPGVLPQEACSNVINTFELHKDLHEEGKLGQGRVEHENKKCTEIYVSYKRDTDFYLYIVGYLKPSLEEYKRLYPFVDKLAHWEICDQLKIQKYLPNEGFFKTHCENEGQDDSSSKRVLAWMIYLNEVLDGGHTEFPSQNKAFQPRTGDILIWPAHFTHPHHGVTSETQTKYIATGWYSYNSKSHS
tara:strand:+ start:141 stop:719 length:579 start_codon:yes stop_codon:yes gene_type:complete